MEGVRSQRLEGGAGYPEAQAPLAPGTSAQYFSQTHNRWLPAVVHGYDARTGTYRLDVHAAAPAQRVRPAAAPVPVPVEEVAGPNRGPSGSHFSSPITATPRSGGACGSDAAAAPAETRQFQDGAAVEYFSQSAGSWLPAVVKGFNKSSGTYVLDIQPIALPNKVRAAGAATGNLREHSDGAPLRRKLLEMSDQDLWTSAWTHAQQQLAAAGAEIDRAKVHAQAEPLWRAWRTDRDCMRKEQAIGENSCSPQPPQAGLREAVPAQEPCRGSPASTAASGASALQPASAKLASDPTPQQPQPQPLVLGPAAGTGQPQPQVAPEAPPAPVPRVPPSSRRIPASGHLGAALGIPCVICYGEEGHLKTLHCQYKAHVHCLKQYWSNNAIRLGRFTEIACPAESQGCRQFLQNGDLVGVVSQDYYRQVYRQMIDADERNQQLIDEFSKQAEAPKPMFTCAICLTEHEVEGCCTLPCGHRFCFESLQYHFEIIVRERRLKNLTCPADGCGFSLRSEEHTDIFRECLSEEVYHKLLEFLARDNPNIFECRYKGCEERVFLDDADDWRVLQCARGHFFCAKCDNGPHPGISCEARQEQLDREEKQAEEEKNDTEAWTNAMAMGWKPCPKRCTFGGGFKAESECDHVTCECGHQFCWACGVDRQVPLEHDNRWHKPSCPYHTKVTDVTEAPKWRPNCPECKKMPRGKPCSFPLDDGYPDSYVHRRGGRRQPKQQERSASPAASLELEFNDWRDSSVKKVSFTHKPLGISWTRGQMPITVSAVTVDSRAHMAGVMNHWFLTKVAGESFLNYDYEEAVEKLLAEVNRLPDDPQ